MFLRLARVGASKRAERLFRRFGVTVAAQFVGVDDDSGGSGQRLPFGEPAARNIDEARNLSAFDVGPVNFDRGSRGRRRAAGAGALVVWGTRPVDVRFDDRSVHGETEGGVPGFHTRLVSHGQQERSGVEIEHRVLVRRIAQGYERDIQGPSVRADGDQVINIGFPPKRTVK